MLKVKEILEIQNVCVDNEEYFVRVVGDYYLKEKMFNIKFISCDLYK